MSHLLHRWGCLFLPATLVAISAAGQSPLEEIPILRGRVQSQVVGSSLPTVHTSNEPRSVFLPWSGDAAYASTRSFLDEGVLPPPETVRIGGFANAGRVEREPGAFSPPLEIETEVFDSAFRADLEVLRLSLIASEDRRNSVVMVVIVGLRELSSLAIAEAALAGLLESIAGSDRLMILRGNTVLFDTENSGPSSRLGGPVLLGGRLDLASSAVRRVEQEYRQFPNMVQTFRLTDRADLSQESANGFEASKTRVIGVGEKQRRNSRNGEIFLDHPAAARAMLSARFDQLVARSVWDVRVEIRFNPRAVRSFRLISEPEVALGVESLSHKSIEGTHLGAGEVTTVFHEIELVQEAAGRVATVRVRFRESPSGAVQSLTHPIYLTKLAGGPLPQTRIQYALATMAERLESSFWARNLPWYQIQSEIETVDPFAAELRYLLDRASQLDSLRQPKSPVVIRLPILE